MFSKPIQTNQQDGLSIARLLRNGRSFRLTKTRPGSRMKMAGLPAFSSEDNPIARLWKIPNASQPIRSMPTPLKMVIMPSPLSSRIGRTPGLPALISTGLTLTVDDTRIDALREPQNSIPPNKQPD